MKLTIKLFIILLLLNVSSKAEIRLPALVADHMVLQRNIKIPVWGWGSAGEKIHIIFKNKTYNCIADQNGKWAIKMDASAAGGPFELTIKGPEQQIVIKDVLIGDVWLCSGQSNMVFDFNNGRAKALYAKDIAASQNDQIRQILVARTISSLPADNFKTSGWKSARPEVLNAFSSAGYFFARELFEKYKVPIGLINTSWGGTIIEAWISEKDIKPFSQFDKGIALLKDTALLKIKRTTKGFNEKDLPGSIYNGMIAPLIPYAIKGAIWYQGEYNTARAYAYRKLFPAMIAGWRSDWKQGNFPFIFQQLVNFKKTKSLPGESDWAELREAQLMTLFKSPNTGMAVGIDIGEANDIHPVDKLDVGKRLALAARKLAYGEKHIVASGPIYKSMKVKNEKIIIDFTNIGAGLAAKNGKELTYFAIAGADKKFYWATAIIKGNQIEVSCKDVVNPVAVRYAWADNPEGCNLINKNGLPASPFRTDDWPGITVPKK